MKSIKWAVRRNRDTYEVINEYFSKLNGKKYSARGPWEDEDGNWHQHDFIIFPHINKSTFAVRQIPTGYKEVPFEWFKQNILKQYYEIY